MPKSKISQDLCNGTLGVQSCEIWPATFAYFQHHLAREMGGRTQQLTFLNHKKYVDID